MRLRLFYIWFQLDFYGNKVVFIHFNVPVDVYTIVSVRFIMSLFTTRCVID